MDSLKKILQNRKNRSPESTEITRLQAYIEKKHHFSPEISLSPRRITIYAPTAAQASILRLDWANLNQLVSLKIYISLKKTI